MQRAAADPQRRLAALAVAGDRRTHELERLGHAVHGPTRERLVTDQLGLPVEAGHQAGQQAHGGPRVAAIEWPAGTVQATPAAVDHDRPVVMALHARPHRLDRGQRGGHVGAVGEAGDDRRAFGQGAEEHGPMRDRLLARRVDGAAAGDAAVDDEDARRRHDSCSARPG